jgi:hypothetical protein
MRSAHAVRIPLGGTLLGPGAAAGAAVRPTPADLHEARPACTAERGMNPVRRREFRRTYGGRRPLRRCVRRHARLIALERATQVPQIRAQSMSEALTDPAELAVEYPGPYGVDMCVRLQSLP